jgi:hypothetical protein
MCVCPLNSYLSFAAIAIVIVVVAIVSARMTAFATPAFGRETIIMIIAAALALQ